MFIHVGFNNYVYLSNILAIAQYDTAPARRRAQHAKETHTLVDMTMGRPTRSIIYFTNGHIAVTATEPSTLNTRLKKGDKPNEI